MAPQASMHIRRGMPRGMAPTRNISASPQATVHRPDEGVYSTAPHSRRPPENIQRRITSPTYGKSDLQKLNTSAATTWQRSHEVLAILDWIQQTGLQLPIQTFSVHFSREAWWPNALDSGSSGPSSSHGRRYYVVFLSKTLYPGGASLHPGV